MRVVDDGERRNLLRQKNKISQLLYVLSRVSRCTTSSSSLACCDVDDDEDDGVDGVVGGGIDDDELLKAVDDDVDDVDESLADATAAVPAAANDTARSLK